MVSSKIWCFSDFLPSLPSLLEGLVVLGPLEGQDKLVLEFQKEAEAGNRELPRWQRITPRARPFRAHCWHEEQADGSEDVSVHFSCIPDSSAYACWQDLTKAAWQRNPGIVVCVALHPKHQEWKADGWIWSWEKMPTYLTALSSLQGPEEVGSLSTVLSLLISVPLT